MVTTSHSVPSEQDRVSDINNENDSPNDQSNKKAYVRPCLTRLFTNEINNGTQNNLFELSGGGGVASSLS